MTTTSTTLPQPTHRLAADDGRVLAVQVTGPDDGRPVLFLHSAPGSRHLDPDPAVTAAAGIRLITFDRAGYGASSSLGADAVPTVAGHAADAAAVLAQLDVGPVDVVGWSAGGRIGAALAAHRPDLVRSLAIVATPAPQSEVPWVPEEHVAMSDALAQDPSTALAGLLDAFAGMAAAIAADADLARSQVCGGPADEAFLATRPDLADALGRMVQAGFAAGEAGVATDICADQINPWGFDPATVRAETTCWYGVDDPIVTPAHGAWYADRIPGATLVEVPEIGHLVIATAWAQILATSA